MQYLISMPTLIAVLTAPLSTQQLVIVDNLPGTFIDISNSGTPLGLGDDDEVIIKGLLTGGNMVLPTSSIVIANNGGVGFRDPSSLDLEPINQPIPSDSAFGGAQATLVFWDDIDDKTGDVYFVQLADRLIIQWNDRNLGGTGARVDFQIQVFENVGPLGIVAQYLFRDIEQPGASDNASATIGYQDGGVGYGDYQWSFDVAGAVSDGTVLSLALSKSSTPMADVIDLGTLGGNTSRAYAVNDLGHVAGQAETVSGDSHAFLWLSKSELGLSAGMNDLGTLGGSESAAFGINNLGHVVGRADTATPGVYHGFLWDPENGMQDLGTLGGQLSEAYAVNDLGDIVGRAQEATSLFRAFYRSADGTMEWLGLIIPGDQESAGFAIGYGNLHMAGASYSSFGHAFAFGGEAGLYELEDLGSGSVVYGLDGLRRVGSVRLASPADHAALWDNLALTDLGTLGGTNSRAFAINDADQIVGESDIATGSKHAFRWQDGVMTDLNTLLAQRAGWVLEEAQAINEVGQIVGQGAINGGTRAFLFTPRVASIPLLSTWGLIIATLLLLTAGSLMVIWRSAGEQTARHVFPCRRF